MGRYGWKRALLPLLKSRMQGVEEEEEVVVVAAWWCGGEAGRLDN